MKPALIRIALVGMALLSMNGPCGSAELSAGGRIGLNVSAIFGDTVQGLTPRFGFNVGLYTTQWLNEKLGLQEELVIDMRGERWTSDPSALMSYSNYATNFTYLDIPLLVKWRFVNNDALRPSLYLGPTFAFPLIAQAEYMGNTKDMLEQTNRFDFDVTAGFSLDIRRGNAFIPIDVRYILGLTNFAKASDYNAHVTHGVFSISVGLGSLLDFQKHKEF